MTVASQVRTRDPLKPPSFTLARMGLLQRKCACGGTPGPTGECEACRGKRLALQRRSKSQAETLAVPNIVHEVLRSSGRPLDPATRTFMESRFGHDFSRVRVHANTEAAESAWAVNALAYTVGQHIVFGQGQYAVGTAAGRRLVAHELTHVLQQTAHLAGGPVTLGAAAVADEQEAERVARHVTSESESREIPAITRTSAGNGSQPLQRLGANPGCTAAEGTAIHQAIFNARGWLLKAIPQVEASPLSPDVLASLRRNFGPTYGVAANASLIAGRLRVAFHEISTSPFSCTGAADPNCGANAGGFANPGSHAATICSNVTLTAGRDWRYQAGVVLHESFHAAFPAFTRARDRYSGWHGVSGATPGYPGVGTDPLLNADTYTTLVMELS